MAAAKVKGSGQLLNQELQDLYDAEKQLVRALPKMAKAASDEELRNALREHLEVTKAQVRRIEQLFESMDMRARSRPCKGMRGIVEEGQEMMAEDREPALADAAIVGSGRRVEHYEMAAYESLRDMLRQMGNKEAAGMIEETLREEVQADRQLAQIGKRLFKEAARPRAEEAAEQTKEPRSRSAASKSARRAPALAKQKPAARSRSRSAAAESRRLSRVLTDPEQIRAWAEDRGAQPACVKGTGGSEDIGMVRLDFPGWSSDEKLQPISWDDWFEKFDERGLALIVEDETATSQKSNFNKLVSRESAEATGQRGRTRSAH
jgi:ferritin-like metal-binding protein YciE